MTITNEVVKIDDSLFSSYKEKYGDFSYPESKDSQKAFKHKVTRCKHELSNILDIISLTDSPSFDVIQKKYELSSSLNNLVARVRILENCVRRYEGV